MWKVLAIACVLGGCGKSERDIQQEKLDRAIERAGGIERDEQGRPYKVKPGAAPAAVDPPVATERWEALSPDEAKTKCDAKDQGACGQLAQYMAMGIGMPEDRKKAEQLVRGACEKDGEAHSCHALAYLYETGIDGKRDDKKAIELYEKACAGKAPDACKELGMVYFSGRTSAGPDGMKSIEFLTKACMLGERTACHQANMVKACVADPSSSSMCSRLKKN